MDTFYIKQGDTLPAIEAILTGPPDPLDPEHPDGRPIDLEHAQVRFQMGRYVDAPAEIVDSKKGHVRYSWMPGDTDVPGAHKAEFVVELPTGGRQTVPNSGYIMVVIEKQAG